MPRKPVPPASHLISSDEGSDTDSRASTSRTRVKKPPPTVQTEDSEEQQQPATPASSRPKRKRVPKKPEPTHEPAVEEEAPESDAETKPKRRRRKPFRFTMPKPSSARKVKTEAAPTQQPATPQPPTVEQPGASEPEPSAPPSPEPLDLAQYTPLQMLLDQLLRVLERKDADEHFARPITEDIAPGYFEVVDQPMDFFTMRKKVAKGNYARVAEFKADVMLIGSNCMQYNTPDTVYYQAARRIQGLASQLCGKEKLSILLKSLPYAKELTREQVGFDLSYLSYKPSSRRKSRAGRHDAVYDGMTADEVIAQVAAASDRAAHTLAARRPRTELITPTAFSDDGTVTLKILTPRCNQERPIIGEERRVVTLGQLVGPLRHGTPGLPGFIPEEKGNCVPIRPLDYGPFSSFAPSYDSSFATLTKEQTDLLADFDSLADDCYIDSLRRFTEGSGSFVVDMVERLTHLFGLEEEELHPRPLSNGAMPSTSRPSSRCADGPPNHPRTYDGPSDISRAGDGPSNQQCGSGDGPLNQLQAVTVPRMLVHRQRPVRPQER